MEKESLGMEESFGVYLQNGRMMAGLLTGDVATRLRVGKDTIRYLEEENHEKLPEPVFVRGFVRNYALEMGLDPEHALALYKEAYAGWDAARREGLRKILRRKKIRRAFRAVLLLVLLISALSWGGLWLLTLFPLDAGGKEAVDPVSAGPSPAVVTPTPPSGHHLEIRAVENTWIKIIIDEELPRSFSVNPGDVLEFDAEKNYNVLIGSATGIRLRLNGKALPVSGAGGQAVNLHLP